ncbi:hypothetical protein Hte_009867 [Hypoxylon texense]
MSLTEKGLSLEIESSNLKQNHVTRIPVRTESGIIDRMGMKVESITSLGIRSKDIKIAEVLTTNRALRV